LGRQREIAHERSLLAKGFRVRNPEKPDAVTLSVC